MNRSYELGEAERVKGKSNLGNALMERKLGKKIRKGAEGAEGAHWGGLQRTA